MSNPAEQEETIRDWVRNWPNERESSDLRYLLGEIDSLRARIAKLVASRDLQPLLDRIAKLEHQVKGYALECREVEQALGKALGYPAYPEDSDDVCVGEHVPGTIAAEAAKRITALERQAEEDADAFRFVAGRCQCRELCSCSDLMKEQAIARLAARSEGGEK